MRSLSCAPARPCRRAAREKGATPLPRRAPPEPPASCGGGIGAGRGRTAWQVLSVRREGLICRWLNLWLYMRIRSVSSWIVYPKMLIHISILLFIHQGIPTLLDIEGLYCILTLLVARFYRGVVGSDMYQCSFSISRKTSPVHADSIFQHRQCSVPDQLNTDSPYHRREIFCTSSSFPPGDRLQLHLP